MTYLFQWLYGQILRRIDLLEKHLMSKFDDMKAALDAQATKMDELAGLVSTEGEQEAARVTAVQDQIAQLQQQIADLTAQAQTPGLSAAEADQLAAMVADNTAKLEALKASVAGIVPDA